MIFGLKSSSCFGILFLITILGFLIYLTRTSLATNLWNVRYLQSQVNGTALPESISGLGWRQQIWLGRAALMQGDLISAQVALSGLQANIQPLIDATLGEFFAANGETEKAIQVWSNQGNIQALLSVAGIAEKEGNLHDAQRAYRAIYDFNQETGTLILATFLSGPYNDNTSAEELLKQSLNRHPDSVHSGKWMALLGEILHEERRYDQAEFYFRELIKDEPLNRSARISLGWIYYERGDGVERATNEIFKAIELDPRYGSGYIALGQIMALEKRYSEADNWFSEAITRDPNVRSWWLERANTARDAGNYQHALNIYNETISRFSDWPQVYYEISWYYKLNGNVEQAAESIEKTLSLMGDHPNKFFYYYRAIEIYRWGDMSEKACQVYTLALKSMSIDLIDKFKVFKLEENCAVYSAP